MATLRFTHGVMNAGKSAVALQTDYNLRGAGMRGVLLTRLDRGGNAITSRIGLSQPARALDAGEDIEAVLEPYGDITYVIVDEAQFLTSKQVEQLARVVDGRSIDVHAFGITTDFTSTMFEGSRRLLELADHTEEIQVKALCWCGATARMNARLVDGELVLSGEQVVVGDTDNTAEVSYVLLCRPHFMGATLGPA